VLEGNAFDGATTRFDRSRLNSDRVQLSSFLTNSTGFAMTVLENSSREVPKPSVKRCAQRY
jgi:hypothetical protein